MFCPIKGNTTKMTGMPGSQTTHFLFLQISIVLRGSAVWPQCISRPSSFLVSFVSPHPTSLVLLAPHALIDSIVHSAALPRPFRSEPTLPKTSQTFLEGFSPGSDTGTFFFPCCIDMLERRSVGPLEDSTQPGLYSQICCNFPREVFSHQENQGPPRKLSSPENDLLEIVTCLLDMPTCHVLIFENFHFFFSKKSTFLKLKELLAFFLAFFPFALQLPSNSSSNCGIGAQ